jgi:hypothetical protein
MRVRVVDYEIGNVAGAGCGPTTTPGHAQMVVNEDRKVIVAMAPVARSYGL